MYENLYCKLFINTKIQVEKMLDIICLILQEEALPYRRIEIRTADINLHINKEYDVEKVSNKRDGFLYWKYFLDIELIEYNECNECEYIEEIKN